MVDFHKRTGPRPLWLHLNYGAAMMASASSGIDMFQASQVILSEALNGVQAYHQSPVKPFKRDMIEIASISGTKILTSTDWYDIKKPAVLLIPSLINSWHIFDIEKDFSFADFLSANGFMPLILEWAEPEKNITFHEFCLHHAIPLIQQIQTKNFNLQGLIGYCMGATMIPVFHKLAPQIMANISKNILIAPPWDFSYLTIEQNLRIQGLAIQMNAMNEIIPIDFVQSLFWAIDPLQVLKKFRKFPNIDNPNRFVRVEDWLNEGRKVSKSVLETCLYDWYRDNKISSGEWIIGGHKIDTKSIKAEIFIGCGLKDNLVPISSTQLLRQVIGVHDYVSVDTGHIGLMASDKSKSQLWYPLVNFLKKDRV